MHYTGNDMPTADAAFHYRWLNRKHIKVNNKYYEKDGKTPFRFGSAHCFCDMEECIETIPLDEVAYGCGDTNNGGYTDTAKKLFNGRNNYYTINVEICNYDILPMSEEDWNASVKNAQEYIRYVVGILSVNIRKDVSCDYTLLPTLQKNDILLLRHYDVTHKLCPKPLLNSSKWHAFIEEV